MLNDIATFQGSQRQVYGPNAHWNDQVVRGKGTTRCLWHACKALGLGLILMLLGACMATIGYYADQLSIAQEIRGNLTINVKNESRGFHLNNLSYAGPIVMGIGGFIVVAACVMTFETRDSAAKVVPARFRFNQISTINNVQNQQNRKSTSSQTARWDHQLCKYRANKSLSPMHEISRNHIVTEFIQISKEAHEKKIKHPFRKSPSAPNLLDNKSSKKKLHNLREGCLILNPKLLRRHALSVDNSGDNSKQKNEEAIEITKFKDSQVSMAMDLYSPNKGLLTIKVKDRLSTERRHQLFRQMRVEDVMDLEQAKQI